MKFLTTTVFVLAALSASYANADESYLNTKFGALAVSEEKLLHFNGKPVTPGILGNASLHIYKSFDLGGKVVVITQNIGGTACPELLNFITIDKSGAKSSPTFGTCSDYKIIKIINNSIIVNFDNDLGRHNYVYADSVLTDNGKIVPDAFNTQPFSISAVINDPDGYTNVRQAANVKSKIISRISNGDLFNTHPQNSEWWQVRLNATTTGYMHKSRILMLRDF